MPTYFRGNLRYGGSGGIAGGMKIGQPFPFLWAAPLEAIDQLIALPANIQPPDEGPRCYGYGWNGQSFPGPYATGLTNFGLAATLTAPSTSGGSVGGSLNIVTSAGVPAVNQYISGAAYQVRGGKRMWYEIKLSALSVAGTGILVGFVASGYVGNDQNFSTLPTDGIFFTKAAAATDFTAIVRKASVSTTVTTTAMANVGDAPLTNSTLVDLGILVDTASPTGILTTPGAVSFYVNGKLAGTDASTDANIPSAVLCYYIGVASTGGAQLVAAVEGAGLAEF